MHLCPVSHAFNESSLRHLGSNMCWPPIGWSFVRSKSQIAMVAGRVCWVVVDEGSFIQCRQSVSKKTVVKIVWLLIRVVVHEEFYCTPIVQGI